MLFAFSVCNLLKLCYLYGHKKVVFICIYFSSIKAVRKPWKWLIFDHVWLVHRGHKPLFVHSFPTFLKNPGGNKKAGDFFSKYGWGNIVKSFTNLFELRYSIIFWQIWAKASWHHHGQSWNDKSARSHLLYIGQAHQQFLEPLYSPAKTSAISWS